MSFIVPENVLLASLKCTDNYSCLEPHRNGDKPICTVDYAFGENLMFIEALNPEHCPYRISFGQTHICSCPLHYFIHTNCVNRHRQEPC